MSMSSNDSGRVHSVAGWTLICKVCQPFWTNSHCSFNRLSTGWMFVYTIQPVVKPVWQPVWQQVVSCKRGFMLQFKPQSREAHCGSCSKRTLVGAEKLARQLTVTHVLCQPTVTRTSVHAARLYVVDVDFLQEPVWAVARVVMRNSYLLQRTELWTWC